MFGHHVFFPLLTFKRGAIDAIFEQNKKEFRKYSSEFDDAFAEVKGRWSFFPFKDIEEETPLNSDCLDDIFYNVDDYTYYQQFMVRFTFESLDDAVMFKLKSP